MTSVPYNCKAELSITDIEEAEEKQIACETYFVDIHDILKKEIKEEANECKPFSEYEVSNECLESNENKKIDYTNSSEFEVMLRDEVKHPIESKFSITHFWENRNFNGFAGDLAESKVNHFNNGVMLKNEDHSDDIDITYDDVKPEIWQEKSTGKYEKGSYANITNILIGTEIGANFSHEVSEDSETWPQQNVEEDGIAVERNNDTRKESALTTNLKNCHMIQKPPHSEYYSKSHLFEPKQEINARPGSKKKPFRCSLCSKSFSLKYNFLWHERNHSEEKKFQCSICSKSFNKKNIFLRHERIHTGEKPYQCKICLKAFTEKSHVRRHERIHTGKKPFQCKICLMNFTEKSTLLGHERIHTGEKPFQCQVCLKNFPVKSRLVAHERIHSDAKPFQCKFCFASFQRKWDVTKHESIHREEKPFQCKICSKSFNIKSYLRKHERIHTGEKPFECKICSRLFNQKSDLTRHERIHTKEKPFQ